MRNAFDNVVITFLHYQVFCTEYSGPLVMYLIFYTRPSIIYGVAAAAEPRALVVK